MQLEQHLGGTLFDRSCRPMELTSLGKYFYPRAKELLVQARLLDKEAHGIASGKCGWLGIGFIRTSLFSVLPVAIRRFKENFPDVRFDLIETFSEDQPERLRDGLIHVGISRFIGDFERPRDLTYHVMFEDPLVVALPANHRLAKKKSVRVADLDGCPYIVHPKNTQTPFSQKILTILRDAGVKPEVSYQVTELHTTLALVAAGLGITFVGRSIVENNRSDIIFRPISDLTIGTTVMAVTRANETSKIALAFLNVLLESG
ncbi:LysR family transcriptional regulator [Betaproteobacteria bacterium]|nr:LysR family transcriptional regulator [Betaproteobacteria bacterium]